MGEMSAADSEEAMGRRDRLEDGKRCSNDRVRRGQRRAGVGKRSQLRIDRYEQDRALTVKRSSGTGLISRKSWIWFIDWLVVAVSYSMPCRNPLTPFLSHLTIRLTPTSAV